MKNYSSAVAYLRTRALDAARDFRKLRNRPERAYGAGIAFGMYVAFSSAARTTLHNEQCAATVSNAGNWLLGIATAAAGETIIGRARVIKRADPLCPSRNAFFHDLSPWGGGHLRTTTAPGAVELPGGILADIRTGEIYRHNSTPTGAPEFNAVAANIRARFSGFTQVRRTEAEVAEMEREATLNDFDADASDMSDADRETCDRLDYARECSERGDWRDPGEIRAGA